jgi:hypothetical protein
VICIHYYDTHKFQVDQEDQEAQAVLEDQGHIHQLEHQAVLEDQVAQADQVDQAAQVDQEDQVVLERFFLDSNHLQLYPATRMYRQANCHQV